MQPGPPSTIIIYEPELGLHPFAIGRLAGMIQVASTKAQVIAATQSPGLISHFLPEDIIVIDKGESENQTIFNRLQSELLNIWLQDFSRGDLWERNIINAFNPSTNKMKRIIVIGEGQTGQSFCHDVLQSHFNAIGIIIHNPVIKKTQGGIVNWQALKHQIETHLLQDSWAIVN